MNINVNMQSVYLFNKQDEACNTILENLPKGWKTTMNDIGDLVINLIVKVGNRKKKQQGNTENKKGLLVNLFVLLKENIAMFVMFSPVAKRTVQR